MANTLTAVIPQLLVRGLSVLRESVQMPFLVNRAYESDAAQRGDTVTIPVPSSMTAKAVTPGTVPSVPEDVAPTLVSIPLDQWQYADFTMTDKDLKEIQEGYLPIQAEAAVKALANKVDGDLLALGSQFYGVSGGFNLPVNDVADIVDARKVLNEQLAPMDPRYLVVSPTREAEMLSIPAFHDASFGVGGEAILEGRLDRRLGFGIAMDQNVPEFAIGTGAGYTTDGSAYSAGVSSVTTITGTGTIKAGDIFQFANHDQTYVATADMVGAGTLSFAPTLQVAQPASAEAITYGTGLAGESYVDHDLNMAFHRDAIAFVTRPLQSDPDANSLGSIVRSISDPESRLTLRLEITRQNKQTNWSWDILYGYAVIRRELGARFVGGTA